MVTSQIVPVVSAWQRYLIKVSSWQALIEGQEPKQTDCGPVYELPNPINRPSESFAVADMRSIDLAGPHYHSGGESEIYIVLEGAGLTVVGGKEFKLRPGSIVVTPPDTAHFTIPNGLVLAVVNTPPFNSSNYVALSDSDPDVGFDHEQLVRLSK